MYLHNNKSWLFSIFAIVTIVGGGSMFISNQASMEAEMIQFSDLSDADIEQILSVKAEMLAADTSLN